MKYFVSFTGKSFEDRTAIENHVGAVQESLWQRGNESVSMLELSESSVTLLGLRVFSDYMRHAFSMIDDVDGMFCLVQNQEVGSGELMEIGYAKARRMPIVIASHINVKDNYLEPMANHCITYADAADLGERVLTLPKLIEQPE
jgi:nucleoside 2-deoxyribosyltransferase